MNILSPKQKKNKSEKKPPISKPQPVPKVPRPPQHFTELPSGVCSGSSLHRGFPDATCPSGHTYALQQGRWCIVSQQLLNAVLHCKI